MSEPASRPPFKLSGMADIKHLNVRKEGPEDDKVLAVDIKLQFSKVDRRLCDYFDDALQSFLWRGDTAALIVRNICLAPVAYSNMVKGSVKIGQHHFTGCEIKKFSICPADGGVVDLVCSVSLFPSASDMPDLAKIVQDQERVEIEAEPDLFDIKPVVDAASKLDSLTREDGYTATLIASGGEVLGSFGDGPDPLYDNAVSVVIQNDKASISLVQRTLKIGYNRAARLLEDMEKAGIISPMGRDGLRMVLASA